MLKMPLDAAAVIRALERIDRQQALITVMR